MMRPIETLGGATCLCVWEVRREHVLLGYWRIYPPHHVMATITEQLYCAFVTQDNS